MVSFSKKILLNYISNFFLTSNVTNSLIKYSWHLIQVFVFIFGHNLCDNKNYNFFFMYSDKSGFVTFTELMIAISLSGQSDPRKKLHLVFNIFDKNNSKSLDISEVNIILSGLKGIMLDQDLDEVNEIMKWDKNNDGSLSEEEFINLILNNSTLKKYFINLIKVHE